MTIQPAPQPQRKRVRVEYSADFAQKLDRLLEEQTALKVSLSELRASIMPRHEIDAEIEKRVSQSAYLSDKNGLENRLKHLEDAPSASWLRAGILISSGIGCCGLIGTVIGIIVTILIASHIIG
jgi:hypothetical protein